MANAVDSILSLQSVAILSQISLASVALTSKALAAGSATTTPLTATSAAAPATTSPASSSSSTISVQSVTSTTPPAISTTPPPPTPKPTTTPKPSQSHPLTSSTTHTTSASHTSAVAHVTKSSGPSPAVIGVVVTLIILAALGAAGFFLRKHLVRKRQAEALKRRNSTWQSPEAQRKSAYVDTADDQFAIGDFDEEHKVGGGGTGIGGGVRDSLPPPPPPAKTGSVYLAAGLAPPTPTPDLERGIDPYPLPPAAARDPYAQVTMAVNNYNNNANNNNNFTPPPKQNALVVPRPESGPVLLYSTPKSNSPDYTFSQHQAPPSPMSPSALPNPHDRGSPSPSSPHTPATATPFLAPLPTLSSPMMTGFPAIPAPVAYPSPLSPAPTYTSGYSPSNPSPPFPLPTPIQPAAPSTNTYMVIRTYMPTLPDELQISAGEHVIVLSEYDDGWALCEKLPSSSGGGQLQLRGVVPQECLQRANAGDKDGVVGTRKFMGGAEGPLRTSVRISSFHVDFEGSRRGSRNVV